MTNKTNSTTAAPTTAATIDACTVELDGNKYQLPVSQYARKFSHKCAAIRSIGSQLELLRSHYAAKGYAIIGHKEPSIIVQPEPANHLGKGKGTTMFCYTFGAKVWEVTTDTHWEAVQAATTFASILSIQLGEVVYAEHEQASTGNNCYWLQFRLMVSINDQNYELADYLRAVAENR